MSTLTSSDFGQLKRPTTRVHAPPGGGSSGWSLGGFKDTKNESIPGPKQKQLPGAGAVTTTPIMQGSPQEVTKLSSSVSKMKTNAMTTNDSVETLIKTQGIHLRIALIAHAGNETSQKFQQNCGQAFCQDFGLDPSNVQEFKARESRVFVNPCIHSFT